ncbi:hypothetical protein GCM10018963_72940 [Saccharothrix longispora]
MGSGRVDLQVGGAAGVPERVVDATAGGARVQRGGDAGRRADRHVAGLRAQHDRTAHGLGDPDVALAGSDLRRAGEAVDRDVAGVRGEADARGLVELDRAVRALEGDLAEPPDAPEPDVGGLDLDT